MAMLVSQHQCFTPLRWELETLRISFHQADSWPWAGQETSGVYSTAHSGLLPRVSPPTTGIISHLRGGELASEEREDTGWPPAFFFGHRVRSRTVLFQLVLFRPGNRKFEPRKLKQRKNQDSRRAKIWSGWEKNLIKEERKEKNTQNNNKNIP